ncbi:hypothetical protein GGR51DRAFT_557549 [Nemania sp. FL0031]|nr:hypothetical protein GGR51DRAFT_557549 [Nemania sp. FL0031]
MSWPRVKTVKSAVNYGGNKLRGLARRLYGTLGFIRLKGKNLGSDADYENEIIDSLDDEFQPTVTQLPMKADGNNKGYCPPGPTQSGGNGTLDIEDNLLNTMDNDRVFEVGLRALEAQGRSTTKRLVGTNLGTHTRRSHDTPILRAMGSPPDPKTLGERRSQSVDRAESMNIADDMRSNPAATHVQQPEESINSPIHELLISRLEAEREDIVRQVLDRLLPQIERVAAAAAEREIDRLIESTRGETTREKIQAILGRINQCSEEELETLFTRSAVMATALRTVLRKAEMEDAVEQWVDVLPGDRGI